MGLIERLKQGYEINKWNRFDGFPPMSPVVFEQLTRQRPLKAVTDLIRYEETLGHRGVKKIIAALANMGAGTLIALGAKDPGEQAVHESTGLKHAAMVGAGLFTLALVTASGDWGNNSQQSTDDILAERLYLEDMKKSNDSMGVVLDEDRQGGIVLRNDGTNEHYRFDNKN